jgi:hypothetical protein
MRLTAEWTGFWLWDAKTLTVSRMQDKIVETPDGVIHAVLGGGSRRDMAMFTSDDGGHTWSRDFSFADTGEYSTAHLDLLSDGETLTISFQDVAGDIKYQVLGYDPEGQSWAAQTDAATVVTGNSARTVSLPTHVEGVDGKLYLLSMATSFFLPRVNISISEDDGATWTTSSARLFGVDKASVRAISTPEVTGVIVATDKYLAWYDALDPDARLVEISEFGSFAVLASHYSTTVVGNDIFLANVTTEDAPQVELFRFDGDTGDWSGPLDVPHTFDAEAYVQISSNDEGHLYLVFDEFGGSNLRVLESLDGGLTWEIEADIDVSPDVYSGFTRMVAPEYFTEDLVVFQMVQPSEGSNRYGVSATVIDVDGDGSAAAARAAGQEAREAFAAWQAGDEAGAAWPGTGTEQALDTVWDAPPGDLGLFDHFDL